MYKRHYNEERHFVEDMYNFQQSETGAPILYGSTVGISYPSKDYVSRAFVSTFICIEYIESGAGVVRYRKQIFHPTAGDTIILPKGQPAQFWTDIENPWKKYWFNVDGALCDKLCEVYKLKNAVLYHNLDLRNEMLELIDISKSEKECTEKLIEITNRMFYKMYCHSIKEEPENLGTQVKKYIDEHLTESFSIDEIEKVFNKSRSQIFRTFKEQYGITPYSHYLNEKLSLSKNLLINTQLSISEIALSLNFYDEYHFSKYFKQKEGVSPLVYRKSNTASLSNI